MRFNPASRSRHSFALILVLGCLVCLASCGDEENTIRSVDPGNPYFRQVKILPGVTTWEMVWVPDPSNVFVMGEDGYVFRNSGSGWTQELSTVDVDRVMRAAWGAADDAYFVGYKEVDTTIVVDNVTVPAPDEPILEYYDGTVFEDSLLTIEWGLYDIWGSANDDIYAVGHDGTVIHFNGTNWETIFTGGESPAWLNSVWGSGSDNVFTVGSDGTLLHYDGVDWSVVPTPVGDDLWDVWGLDDSTIYITGARGTILAYDGETFTRMSVPVRNSIYGIWGTAEDNLYAVGWGGVILRYDGTEWLQEEKITDFGLLSVCGSGPDDIYAAGEVVLHYDGTAWSPVAVRDEPDFEGMWAGYHNGTKEIFAVGTGGTIVQSSGGDVFNIRTVDGATITADLYDVTGVPDSGAIFIVGAGGTILERDADDESLTNWLDISPGVTADLYGVDMLADTTTIAVGSGGAVLEYDNGAWTEQNPTSDDLYDVWLGVVGEDTVAHAVGANGRVLYFNDAWQTPNSPTSADLRAVYGLANGDAYAVGDVGTMMKFNGATHNWTLMNTGTIENLTDVWIASNGAVLVSAEHGRVLYLQGATLVDLETDNGVDINGLYGLSASDFFTAGDFNHLLHYAY